MNTTVWKGCLLLAVAVFAGFNAVGIGFYVKRRKTRQPVSLVAVFIGVTFCSVLILLFPYIESLIGSNVRGFAGFLQTIRSSLQVFSLDGEYVDLYEAVPASTGIWAGAYRVFSAILYVLAPILLVSFVVSLFRNTFTRWRVRFVKNKNFYVFSELSEKSLILAESLQNQREEGKKSILIFTDVYEQREEWSAELVDRARILGAICLKSDILNLLDESNADYARFKKKKAQVRFFILGPNEAENIGHARKIIENLGDCEGSFHLHVLTHTEEAKMMIGSAMTPGMKMDARFIDSTQAMVYSYLYDNVREDAGDGVLMQRIRRILDPDPEQTQFSDRIPILPSGERVLSVILVGLGRYGTELLRALTWYAQIPNLRLQVHIFERDPLAEQKFTSLCPELMAMNHSDADGEAHYDLYFHHAEDGKGIDVDTIAFDREIRTLSNAAIAFVTLGDDETNIRIAVKMRQLFTQSVVEKSTDEAKSLTPETMMELQPAIQALVFDPARKKVAEEHALQNFKGQEYRIDFIGDLESEWTYDRIINDRLEEDAKKRHLKWSDELSFYQYEYNRKSSMSSAIRTLMRKKIQMTGADIDPKERSKEEKEWIEKYEHIGWNAYMRSEGYCYAPQRNDLAKCHPDLVAFDALTEKEKEKDNV